MLDPSQKTRGVGTMLDWRWPIVYDAGPTSDQHWANASCLLRCFERGYFCHWLYDLFSAWSRCWGKSTKQTASELTVNKSDRYLSFFIEWWKCKHSYLCTLVLKGRICHFVKYINNSWTFMNININLVCDRHEFSLNVAGSSGSIEPPEFLVVHEKLQFH